MSITNINFLSFHCYHLLTSSLYPPLHIPMGEGFFDAVSVIETFTREMAQLEVLKTKFQQ